MRSSLYYDRFSGAPVPALVRPFRRSALQVALLMVATLGVYQFYWFYRVHRWTTVALEKDEDSALRTLGLIVPILNVVLLHHVGRDIEALARRANVPVWKRTMPICDVLLIASLVARFAHKPFIWLTFVLVIPIAAIHVGFEQSQIVLSDEDAAPTPFRWYEWTLLVVGFGLQSLALLGYAVDGREIFGVPFFVFGALQWTAIVLGLGLFAGWDRRRVSDAIATRSDDAETRDLLRLGVLSLDDRV